MQTTNPSGEPPHAGQVIRWAAEDWTIKRFLGGKVLLWHDGRRDRQVWLSTKLVMDLVECGNVKPDQRPNPETNI